MSEEDQEPDFPFYYVRLGELEFQIEGKQDESTEEVGKEFDNRLGMLVKYAQDLQQDNNGSGYQ